MNRFQAERIARSFLVCIEPAIEFGLICGSIRRREPSVNDAEIVVVPTMVAKPALFDAGELVSKLDGQLERLVGQGFFKLAMNADGKPRADGDRYKRFIKDGLPIDLFIVTPPAQLGWIIAVRTGPASFSTQLVTPREKGGFLPIDAKLAGGQLFRRGKVVETPTEKSFFDAMGMRYVEPEYRHSYAPFAKGAHHAFPR